MVQATILYVEDDELLRVTVQNTLELEGWRVESCSDGLAALSLLESAQRYDLLLFDNELPGASGLELLRHVRMLPYRQRTPIVIISATDSAREAYRAGADAFLKKPDDINQLASTIARLLNASADTETNP
jgi:two-component system phosphate regulon response regulator PhoB/OmpR-family two-component system manganese-sensing response regulator